MVLNPKTAIDSGWILPSLVEGERVDPFDKEHDLGTRIAQNGVDLSLAEEVVLRPLQCKNVAFAEGFNLPSNVVAQVFIRSSLSRQGIFCSCGLYDAGFRGIGGVTLYNMSTNVLVLKKNSRVGQVIFLEADSYDSYDGFYNKTQTIDAQPAENKQR